MQVARVLSTAVFCFLLGSSVVGFAQQQEERRDEVKPPRQEEAKPPRQEEAKPPRQDQVKPPKHEQQREEQAKPSHEQRPEEHARPSREQQPGQQAQHARPAGKSTHIPDEKFRANFGRQHTFVVNRPVVVQGQPQFVYGGYTFVFVDPWPVEWAYTDDCYIDYIDGDYFLFDVLHPGVRVALFVVM
jgi:hypothetical protein